MADASIFSTYFASQLLLPSQQRAKGPGKSWIERVAFGSNEDFPCVKEVQQNMMMFYELNFPWTNNWKWSSFPRISDVILQTHSETVSRSHLESDTNPNDLWRSLKILSGVYKGILLYCFYYPHFVLLLLSFFFFFFFFLSIVISEKHTTRFTLFRSFVGSLFCVSILLLAFSWQRYWCP